MYDHIYTDVTILAPLPVEESDVESGAEDVPTTKAELAINNDEPADSTMKDKEEEGEEDDDDDPETSVPGSGGLLNLTDYGSASLLKLLRTTAQTSKMWVIVHSCDRRQSPADMTAILGLHALSCQMEGLREEGRSHLGDRGQPRVSPKISPKQPPVSSLNTLQRSKRNTGRVLEEHWRQADCGPAKIQHQEARPPKHGREEA